MVHLTTGTFKSDPFNTDEGRKKAEEQIRINRGANANNTKEPGLGIGSGCLLWIIIIASIFIASCSTTKNISRNSTTSDSTNVKKIDSLIEVRRLDSIGFANLLQIFSESNIVFRDTGSVKIIYDTISGGIREIEGPVRYIKQKSEVSKQESYVWKKAYDSLVQIRRMDSANVKTEEKNEDIYKKSKAGFNWLAFLIGCACGIGFVTIFHSIIKKPL